MDSSQHQQHLLAPATSTPISINVNSSGAAAAGSCGQFATPTMLFSSSPGKKPRQVNRVTDPLICPYCSRAYFDRNRYEIHIRFYTGETPFKCPICSKGFRENRKLKLHIRRHTSSLRHKCHLCPRSFEGSKPMTITIQYKIYPESKGGPQNIAVQRDITELLKDQAASMNDTHSTSSFDAAVTPAPHPLRIATSKPKPPLHITSDNIGSIPSSAIDSTKFPPIPISRDFDPMKDTITVTTVSGNTYEVPTVFKGGYDLDQLLCKNRNKSFKNDKTLIGHMLNHFGVTPKMTSCPVCDLTVKKKSYARHIRLYGNVIPEICQYCHKEFREKRSLDKHIKAIHFADRPYSCHLCNERFRHLVKTHINRHFKQYPFKCELCTMTFQKQEALNTHLRAHRGEKPYVCEICDKSFTSEKNKRIHVLRHQGGGLPHKCDVCCMTFQTPVHLPKHSFSHERKTEVVSAAAKMITFLKSVPLRLCRTVCLE